MGRDESMIEHVNDRPGHDLRYAMDYSKAEKELDWRPGINFDNGLKGTVKWYTDNKEWWQRIKSGEYMEYYRKQYGLE